MILKARNEWWRQTMKLGGENDIIQAATRYANDERFSEVESSALSHEELDHLRSVVQHLKVPTAKALVAKIDTIKNLYAEPKGAKVKKLEAIVDAVRAYVGPMQRRWVYIEQDDGIVLPYFVKDVSFTKRKVEVSDGVRYVYPPYTTISVTALDRGSITSKSYRWEEESFVPGKTAVELLNQHGLFLETPWVAAKYDKEMARYQEIIGQLGAQYAAVGYGRYFANDRWYSSTKLISMVREGYSAKVVIDDNEEDESDTKSSSDRGRSRDDKESNAFWQNYDLAQLGKNRKKKYDEEEDDDDDDEEFSPEQLEALKKVVPPVHPYIRVFDLEKHNYVTIHENNLQEYPWDASLIDKLILPAETKDLIQILVSGTQDSKEDIIRGKMQGIIVIATGEPGTGKTLTAEVFSETIKRPLYVIQCAQLGTDAKEIENRLSSILRRSQRWQAILLIDEADVYIRSRGDDIEQNAIVGVFLRVLEYYRGVLFMTSNRATVIDDAIMSRASSWIRYAMPGVNELKLLWRVLSTQYEIELSDSNIDSLIEHLPKMSGRCVRNLLKLARHLSQARKEKVTETMLRQVAQFQYLPHHTDEELRDAAK